MLGKSFAQRQPGSGPMSVPWTPAASARGEFRFLYGVAGGGNVSTHLRLKA